MLPTHLSPNLRGEIVINYEQSTSWIVYNYQGLRCISGSLLLAATCPFDITQYHQCYIRIGDATAKKIFKVIDFGHNEFRIEDGFFHVGSDLIALDKFTIEYFINVTMKLSE